MTGRRISDLVVQSPPVSTLIRLVPPGIGIWLLLSLSAAVFSPLYAWGWKGLPITIGAALSVHWLLAAAASGTTRSIDGHPPEALGNEDDPQAEVPAESSES